MKELVRNIQERRKRYELSSIDQQGQDNGEKTLPWHDPRVASLFIEEAEVVGIKPARAKLTNLLVGGAPRREVISVVGMGGLGKTTLAKKVYDNLTVLDQFDCYAWITVSQTYKVEDLLRTVVKMFCSSRNENFPEGIDTMNEESLIRKSREYLQQKRYVVVFDDVWKVDFWEAIEHALPDNKGGRIMITTRSQDVAHFCKKSCFVHVHHLQPLPPNKAWELFCRKAFQFELEGKCPPEFEDMSREIVRKCEIVQIYKDEYLREPNQEDLNQLLRKAEYHGFPTMIGSLDCMHWDWKPQEYGRNSIFRTLHASLNLQVY